METRQIVAYALIALLALFAAGVILRLRYNSYDQNLARDRRRERKARERRTAEREEGAK